MLRHPPRPTLLPYTTLFRSGEVDGGAVERQSGEVLVDGGARLALQFPHAFQARPGDGLVGRGDETTQARQDRKSTRLNSSHVKISYAVFCLKKKKQEYYKRK